MNLKNIVQFLSITILFLFAKTALASDLVDYGALNSRIIVLHFDDGYVRYHQRGESRQKDKVFAEPLDVVTAMDKVAYTITAADGFYANGSNPVKVERKSKGTEFTWLCQNWQNGTGCVNGVDDHAKEHWLYLHLPEPLQEGKTYRITTGLAGNKKFAEFVFSYRNNRTEAIHVNLVGYDPVAAQKYGYVYHWSGSGGSISFSAYDGNPFYLIDTHSGEKVYTGTLAFRKSSTNIETRQAGDTPNQNFLGAEVWECNFSEFNQPGEYILAVEGIGHSFPFKIKPDAYRHAFYNSIRGLYHNRSGIAMEEPFTEFTRPAPHNPKVTPGFAGKLYYTTSRFIDWNDLNASDSDKAAIEAGILGPVDTWGWYQDAGDWDGYFSHLKVPVMLMLTWEIAPGKFGDGELNLPEGTNGLPDILDEARWLIRFFHRTRHELMNKGYGTGGVGSRVAPDWYEPAGDGTPSYLDNGKWIISGEDPFTTYFYAGLAGHYAAILNKLGVEDPEGINWQQEAMEAYAWAKANTKTTDLIPSEVHDYTLTDYQLYAAVNLFRLTGNEEYAQVAVEKSASVKSTDVLDESKQWGVYSLMMGKEFEFPEQQRIEILKGAVIATADQKYNSVEMRACRFGGNIWMPMLIGQGTTPQVFEIMMGHYIAPEKAPHKTEAYLNSIYTTADYFLGCNPHNMTWITHVGVRYPERVMHLDSWYSDTGEIIPGITPYGPWRDQAPPANLGPWDLQWSYKTLYPEGIGNWPGHERWFNNYTTPVNAEFTVHQNTILSSVVYGFLSGTYDGSYEPNQKPEVSLDLSTDSLVVNQTVTLTATASDPNGSNDIARVEFYNGWHKIGESTSAPYDVEWYRPPYGTVQLSAKVVDKSGYSAQSEKISLKLVPASFNISIEVKDSITGNLLEGSEVIIGGQQAITGSNGVAVFENIKAVFNLQVNAQSHESKTLTNISVYSDTMLTVQLAPAVYQVTVMVQDANTGAALSLASVVMGENQQATDATGSAFFNLLGEEYQYSATKAQYATESGNLKVESDTTVIVLLERTEAEVKFVLKEGTTPVNKATVVLNGDTLISTSLGIARFRNVPVKTSWEYSITKEGYKNVTGTVYLEADTTLEVSMQQGSNSSEINAGAAIKVWPNPVGEVLYLTTGTAIKEVELCSLSGIRCWSATEIKNTVNEFSLNGVKPGIYLLNVVLQDGVVKTYKLVKQ